MTIFCRARYFPQDVLLVSLQFGSRCVPGGRTDPCRLLSFTARRWSFLCCKLPQWESLDSRGQVRVVNNLLPFSRAFKSYSLRLLLVRSLCPLVRLYPVLAYLSIRFLVCSFRHFFSSLLPMSLRVSVSLLCSSDISVVTSVSLSKQDLTTLS